ncbi:MAG TPA: hypothetical protein VG963_05010, partial [Polyangiaceae bacterium]|nr:hypothetical protein [Polyangiaceae bacterium]
MKRTSTLSWVLAGLCCLQLCACAHAGADTRLADLREAGSGHADDETLARWLIAELISSGGSPERARAARQKLDQDKPQHYLAQLALGLDDAFHGHLGSAPGHFWAALEGASHENGVEARLVAWFAASQTTSLADHDPGLWARTRASVEKLIDHPEGIGWRARAQLVQWWLDE